MQFDLLALALSFLTIIPVKLSCAPKPGDLGRAGLWFPIVGLFIGATLVGLMVIFQWVFPPVLTVILVMTAWAIITGGIHLDGLADSYDGLFCMKAPEKRLEIMSDPRLDSFGVLGLLLHILVKAVTLFALIDGIWWLALLMAPVVARWMVLVIARQPAAKPGGMYTDFSNGLTIKNIGFIGLLPVSLAILSGWHGILAMVAACLVTWMVYRISKSRLGGMTGDILGLIIEVNELAILLVFAIRMPAL
jgi:adenosylcobinamide-GDP ribazoletransferase